MSYPPAAIQILLVLLAVTAAWFDWRERRVPNWLSFSGFILGLAVNGALFHWTGIWIALEGAGLALLIYFPLWMLRGMGAGDVKLMAALGSIAGPANWVGIAALTWVIGGIVALILIVAKHRVHQTLGNIGTILQKLSHLQAPYDGNPQLDVRDPQSVRLPHAVSIALGTAGFLLAVTVSR